MGFTVVYSFFEKYLVGDLKKVLNYCHTFSTI